MTGRILQTYASEGRQTICVCTTGNLIGHLKRRACLPFPPSELARGWAFSGCKIASSPSGFGLYRGRGRRIPKITSPASYSGAKQCECKCAGVFRSVAVRSAQHFENASAHSVCALPLPGLQLGNRGTSMAAWPSSHRQRPAICHHLIWVVHPPVNKQFLLESKWW